MQPHKKKTCASWPYHGMRTTPHDHIPTEPLQPRAYTPHDTALSCLNTTLFQVTRLRGESYTSEGHCASRPSVLSMTIAQAGCHLLPGRKGVRISHLAGIFHARDAKKKWAHLLLGKYGSRPPPKTPVNVSTPGRQETAGNCRPVTPRLDNIIFSLIDNERNMPCPD